MDRRNFMKGGIGSSLLALLPCRKLFAKKQVVRIITLTQGRFGRCRDMVDVSVPKDFPWRQWAPLKTWLVTLTTNSSPVTCAEWPEGEPVPFVGERLKLKIADMDVMCGTCIERFPAKKYAYPDSRVSDQYVIRISGAFCGDCMCEERRKLVRK